MDTDNEQIIEPVAEELVFPVAEVTYPATLPNPEPAIEVLPVSIPATAPETEPSPSTPEPLPEVSAVPTAPTEPELIPTPIPEPIPEQVIEPISTPIAIPIPPEPRSEATQPSSSPELTTGDPSPINAAPFDINSLSDADLKAAAALYTKRNQAEISKKGVAKRQEIMELNLREIVDFLSLNNGSPLPRIAKHTNITLGTTSKYLRQLDVKGKVRAEGWGKTRRYYLK